MLKLRSSFRAALVGAPVLLTPFTAEAAQTVPFVGCASDGQQGPVGAPKGQPKALAIDPAAAKALAWYQARLQRGRARAARLEVLLVLRLERRDADDRAERPARRRQPADRRPRCRPHRRHRRHERPLRRRQDRRAHFRRGRRRRSLMR